MSVISCPRCDDSVRVPSSLLNGRVSLDSLVRCPWCSETFAVAEAMGRVPPLLEIVSLDETEFGESGFLDNVNDTVIEDFPSFSSDPDTESFQLADPILRGGPSIGAMARPVTGSRSRAGSKQASPVGTVIKIGLGGLMAVPLAAAILSLAGRPLPIDLGFFPFQGDGSGSRNNRVVDGSPLRRAAAPNPSPATSRVAPPASRVLTPKVMEPVPSTDQAAEAVSPKPTAADDALAKIRDADGSLEMPAMSSEDVPDVPVTAEIAKPDSSTMTFPESMDSAPPKLSPELADAIADANATLGKAIEIMDSGAIDRQVFGNAYRGIAEVASLLDDTSAGSEEVSLLMKRVARSSLARMYSQVGRQWLNAKSRKTDGILLIGDSVLSDTDARIDFGDNQTLAVQYDKDLPGGRVIALGRIQSDSGDPVVTLVAVQSAR